jgi:hypothetical protein
MNKCLCNTKMISMYPYIYIYKFTYKYIHMHIYIHFMYTHIPKVIKKARRIPKATVTSNREEIEPLIDLGLHSERYKGV